MHNQLNVLQSNVQKLNEEQQQAVCHGTGPALVLAGPGSGKTFTITSRISFLIQSLHISPEQILVITFTKEAAFNMQRRFQTAMNGSCPVWFGTFHSCFYQILRHSGFCSAESILTDSEKNHLILPIIKEFLKIKSPERKLKTELLQEDAKKCLAAIGYYKNTQNLEQASALLDLPYKEHFSQLLKSYEEKRAESGKLDFDDMLYQCYRMLQNRPEVRAYWQKRFSYILVDEFQDINSMQYEVIKLLAGKEANLFVVGDDDQSIYGFRGARPELMRKFLEDFPQSKQIVLNRNYRSHPDIVAASGKVIRENKMRFRKEMMAMTNVVNDKNDDTVNESVVQISTYTERREQFSEMVRVFQAIQQQAQNGTLSSHAVLFRTNAMMQMVATGLLKAQIPFVMKEKVTCLYDHFIMQEVSVYFRLAMGEFTRKNLLRILNIPYRGLPREAFSEEQIQFSEVRSYLKQNAEGRTLAEQLLVVGELEEQIKKLSGLSPYLALLFLRKGVGYDSYLKKKASGDLSKYGEWMELLEGLGETLKAAESMKEWLEDQEIYRQNMRESKMTNPVNGINGTNRSFLYGSFKEEGVHLMTVHGSKGLEFDHVWIPDVNEGIFPYGKMLSAETIEEERRLFYVAMTRAKKSLRLSYVTGTQDRPRLRSHFLNPIL